MTKDKERLKRRLVEILTTVEIELQSAVSHADLAKSIELPDGNDLAAEAIDALNAVEDQIGHVQARLRVARMDLE